MTEFFDIVNHLININNFPDDYMEELQLLKMTLNHQKQIVQELGSDFSDYDIQLVRQCVQDSESLIQQLPQKASRLHALKELLPGGYISKIQGQNDKCHKVLNILQSSLALHTLTNRKKFKPNTVETLQIPQSNDHLRITDDPIQREATWLDTGNEIQEPKQGQGDEQITIKLKLSNEDAKNNFSSVTLNTFIENDILFKKDDKETTKDGILLQRDFFVPLKRKIPEIMSLSRNHAKLLVERKIVDKTDSEDSKTATDDDRDTEEQKISRSPSPMPKSPTLKTDDKVDSQNMLETNAAFITCQDINEEEFLNFNNQNTEVNYEYKFYIEATGGNGIYVYKKPLDENSAETDTTRGQWIKVNVNSKFELQKGDTIGLIMKRPNYNIPIIAYEFSYKEVVKF